MRQKIKANRKVIAKIRWVDAVEGGRATPPRGHQYSTVARFDKEAEKWPRVAWSIVANFMGEPDESSCVEAELRLLAQNAPSYLLDPGSKFELYEGRRLVAHGEVLRKCIEEKASRKNRTHHLSAHVEETE